MQTMIEILGGGAPENNAPERFLKKNNGFALELLRFRGPILSCHPDGRARRISKENRHEILRQEGRQFLSCTNHAQNDMTFKIETNFCHPEDEIRRISKEKEQKTFHFAQNDKKCAFTLAEVLITLGVIGIVAAMTLPTVINNKRNKELETAFKRSYTVISQALNMYQAETGERLTSEDLGFHELKPILMKYMNVIDDCGWGTESNGSSCIPNYQDPEKNSKIYKNLKGNNTINLNLFDDGQFVLNDGSLILVENSGSIVNDQKRVFISVDVNGYNKNPNRLGQDLFMFQIDKKGNLLPMGANGTIYYSANDAYCYVPSTSGMSGASCTIKALSERDYFKNLPK